MYLCHWFEHFKVTGIITVMTERYCKLLKGLFFFLERLII